MTAPTQVTLRVELDSQDDSISGRVLDGDGAGIAFLGWVGLAAAIEAASAASAQNVDRPHEEESRQ
jgi:hypothetical protein